MNADQLYEKLKGWANDYHARGTTSAELYEQADAQERGGMTASAPYTRCLASFVESLEKGRDI